jgi:hypothetical protein
MGHGFAKRIHGGVDRFEGIAAGIDKSLAAGAIDIYRGVHKHGLSPIA